MEAKELMIGDWVIDKAVSDNPVQVLQINQQKVHYNRGMGYMSVSIKLLSPVPLNREILEKNGFVTNRGTTSWIFETERDDIIDIYGCKDYHLSINIQDTHGSGKGYRWMLNNFVIFYVHQLQHALRLCGVEKEIEL